MHDRHGAVIGVLTVAAETTQVTRRLQSLGELTARLACALTLDDVARVVLAYAMASFDVDHVSFAVDDGARVALACGGSAARSWTRPTSACRRCGGGSAPTPARRW